MAKSEVENPYLVRSPNTSAVIPTSAGVDYERELIALCYSFPDREARIRAFRDRKTGDAER